MKACAAGGGCCAEDVFVDIGTVGEDFLEIGAGGLDGGDGGFVGEVGLAAVFGLVLFDGEVAR